MISTKALLLSIEKLKMNYDNDIVIVLVGSEKANEIRNNFKETSTLGCTQWYGIKVIESPHLSPDAFIPITRKKAAAIGYKVNG